MKKQNQPENKICESCGRPIEYRKKWERNWDSIKFCSDECRKNKNNFDYSEQILNLLKQRAPTSSICPSEVLPPEHKQNHLFMEHVRRSSRKLAHAGLIEITQKGKPVDPESFKGPIRLRLKR